MKPLALSLALALPLTLAACGGGSEVEGGSGAGTGNGAPAAGDLPAPKTDADRAMVAYLEGLGGITEVVKGVTDEASAQGAAKEIDAIIQELQAQMGALQSLTESERVAAVARYSGELQAIQVELSRAMMPLATRPGVAQALSDAMAALPKPSAK